MRRMGLGRKLLELGLQKAKSIGFYELYISVDSNNESSIHIIESNGGILFKNRINIQSNIENIVYRISLG
jgi:predicted acetyltransferase